MALLLLFVPGVLMLIVPVWFDRPARQRHARRLAALDAGAPERFFEERRTLLAYPPARTSLSTRLTGAVLIAWGIARAYGHTLFGWGGMARHPVAAPLARQSRLGRSQRSAVSRSTPRRAA